MTGRRTAWIGAGLLLLAGCDGSSLPFSQYLSEAIPAACNLLVQCGEYPDQATCLSSEQIEPHYSETLSRDISVGTVTYDGTRARACLNWLSGLSSCTAAVFLGAQYGANCGGVFSGTVAAGGVCFFQEECAGGAPCTAADPTCLETSQCCPGSCAALPAQVAVGGNCLNPPGACTTGSACVYDATAGTATCVIPSATPGAACTESTACVSPLYCDDSEEGQPGTCKMAAPSGGACNPSVGSVSCADYGDVCDGTTSVCTPQVALGGACATSNESCVSYGHCDATGTCVQRPTLGGACDPASGVYCLGAEECDPTTGTCMFPTGTGGACQ